MESEKVKEIKKALEQNDDNGIMYEVNDEKRTCKFIHHKDILTLINELENNNKRIKQSAKNLAFVNEKVIKEHRLLKKQAERLLQEIITLSQELVNIYI